MKKTVGFLGLAATTLIVVSIGGCGTVNTPLSFQNGDICDTLRHVYRASKDGFQAISEGVATRPSRSIYVSHQSKLQFDSASNCVVRTSGNENEFYCRWQTGNNIDEGTWRFKQLDAAMKLCFKDGNRYEHADSVRTSFNGQLNNVTFYLAVQRASPPFYVYFSARP